MEEEEEYVEVLDEEDQREVDDKYDFEVMRIRMTR